MALGGTTQIAPVPRNDDGLTQEETRKRRETGVVMVSESKSSNWKEIRFATAVMSLHVAYGLFLGMYIEGWTLLDSVYFEIVTLTTVGYGDVKPLTENGRFLTGIYIIYGVVLITWSISALAEYVTERLEKFKSQADLDAPVGFFKVSPDSFLGRNIATMKALIYITIILLIGITYMMNMEGHSFKVAFYFCVVTLTTVGYGDINIFQRTFETRLFLIFYIIFGTALLAKAVGASIDRVVEAKKKKMRNQILHQGLTMGEIDMADADMSGELGEAEFIVFKLQRMGLVKHDDLKIIKDQFASLDVDGSGAVTYEEACGGALRKSQV